MENSIQKTMATTFFINHDGSHRRWPSKNQWRPLSDEILALFGDHHFCGCLTFFFLLDLRYRGGLGPGLYPTKPLSIFLSNIFKFNTIFLNL